MTFNLGFTILTSEWINDGAIYMHGTQVLIHPKTLEEFNRKLKIYNDIVNEWKSHPDMRKWYEYIGEV